jgi:hypothetical protein
MNYRENIEDLANNEALRSILLNSYFNLTNNTVNNFDCLKGTYNNYLQNGKFNNYPESKGSIDNGKNIIPSFQNNNFFSTNNWDIFNLNNLQNLQNQMIKGNNIMSNHSPQMTQNTIFNYNNNNMLNIPNPVEVHSGKL